jgi:alkylhydroperoxidase family enzyme
MALADFQTSDLFDARERAALKYARLFKQGEHAIDSDEVYDDLKKVFSEEEIIELGQMCAQTDGVGKLVKSLNVMSWGEACEINPELARTKNAIAAE